MTEFPWGMTEFSRVSHRGVIQCALISCRFSSFQVLVDQSFSLSGSICLGKFLKVSVLCPFLGKTAADI
jgi:hypothetical protein